MISSCQYAPARRPSPAVAATTKFAEEPQLEEEDTELEKEYLLFKVTNRSKRRRLYA
jgi:hypothetical protein